MAVKCTNCGGSHPKWDCTKPAQKSTAARKDVPENAALDNSTVRVGGSVLGSTPKLAASEPIAGTQSLPVDTHSKSQFDRNEYQRLYMRDKATIKRLGLNCTVAQYRESLK